jgi:hypothetical protein
MGRGKKSKGASTESSGLRKAYRANQQARRLRMKIARWKRYQKDPSKAEAGKHRGNWDTKGLEKHLAFVQKAA